ncbi:TPA: restriction endonuclease subunit S [Vibrio vulnificus]|uniref:restriction endonuclease subunit S n=1 Tax=Vibrio vulnificus TaxID=672 RepID=UPI001029819D|nr:restriction endonuclease subunit S [Vibrio vulnificus]RZQ41641.1 restriction endonuclease subunit S [Vibrio vulnificus]HAS8150335.1 restriction endonuclease subunit S [Vibrio vulnificus]
MSFDWPIVRLENVTSRIGDGLHGTPKYDDNGDYYFINGNNLSNGRIVINEKTKRTDKEQYLKHKKDINDRTLFVSINGTLGNIATYREEKIILGKSACYLNVLPEVDKDYIKYVLTSKHFQDYIHNLATGSTIKNVGLKLIREYEFRLPELAVQKEVSNILNAIDFKIENNTQTNQTLEQMAQAIFKSWFVDFDPVKAKMNGEQPNGMDTATASLFPEKLVESELGLIPEGWQVGALSSVVDVVMGQSPKGSTYNDQNEGTPLVNGPVEFGVYHPVAQKWTTAPTKMSKNKDLIVCVRGSTTGRYVVSDGEYCLGRGVCSIRSNDFPSFASYLFKSELNSLLHLTTGSTFPSWSGPTLKNFKVVVPPEAIIEKFELLIGKLCEMMARNIGQNETLSTLRDTLLPKLLSGEIDLNSEVVA